MGQDDDTPNHSRHLRETTLGRPPWGGELEAARERIQKLEGALRKSISGNFEQWDYDQARALLSSPASTAGEIDPHELPAAAFDPWWTPARLEEWARRHRALAVAECRFVVCPDHRPETPASPEKEKKHCEGCSMQVAHLPADCDVNKGMDDDAD